MKHKYRIVGDKYLGYECQVKYWWFPICWFQIAVNTHATVEAAKAYIEYHKFKLMVG